MEANLAWRASSCIRQGERGRCHYDEVALFAKWDLSTIGRVLEASSRIRNQPSQRSSSISPDCIPEEDEMPRMGDRTEAENLHLEFVSSDGVVSEQGLL